MEERETLSVTQLMALSVLGMAAPAAELLPALAVRQAGTLAWLAPVLALPPVWLLLWLIARSGGKTGLIGQAASLRPRALGRGLLLLYMMGAAVLLALRLASCALRLSLAGPRDGSPWFFICGVAGTALWISRGRTASLGRTAQLLLGLLGTAIGAVVVFSLPSCRVQRLWQVRGEDWLGLARSTASAAGVLCCGLPAAFLGGETDWQHGRGTVLWWTAAGAVGAAALSGAVLSSFGPRLTGRLPQPFLALAGKIGVEGAFQRVESITSAVMLFSDTVLTALLLRVIHMAAAEAFPRRGGKTAKCMLGGGGVAAALWLTGPGPIRLTAGEGTLWSAVYWGCLALAAAGAWRGRRQR